MLVRRVLLAALCCLACVRVAAAPSVLNATSHAANKIAPAINAVLGAGKVDNPIFVDYDPSVFNAGFQAFVADSSNSGASFISVASGLTANHATYQVINASLCCYAPLTDQLNYAALATQGTMFTNPVAIKTGGALPTGTAPPTALSTVSSPNSANGGSGWGVEFGLSTSYLGLDTSEDSWNSAALAGFYAALLFNHPTWTIFDAKAALRVTAGNWATGYSSAGFGFGFINWTSANAGPTLYLQGPGMAIQNSGFFAQITLYPFRQTRRIQELLYSVSSSYTWPVKNEYSAADLAASGGTLLFTSNGSDVTPTFTYAPAVSGSATFVAFTTDGSGNYSRVEAYSESTQSFTVGTACRN